MKARIKSRVDELMGMASGLSKTNNFEIPRIVYDLRGRSAGMCELVGDVCTLRFNPTFFEKNSKDILKFIVPHEVAHYVTWMLYDNVKPHGNKSDVSISA